jgi:nitrate/TMAO reductase-like tetraheme cytochrome c subunit
MTTLSEQNIKMVAEIELVKSIVNKLDNKNTSIKYVLDMKQSEWTKIEEKKSKTGKIETKTT